MIEIPSLDDNLLVRGVVAVLAAVELLDLVAVLLPDVVDHDGL